MPEDMTFCEAVDLARAIQSRFSRLEGRPWGAQGCVIELMKQVGELAQYVMVVEGYYYDERNQLPQYQADTEKIGNELADILYAVIRLADHYSIDLLEAHLKARRDEDRHLARLGA